MAKCSECYSKCFVICENQSKLYKLEFIKRKKPKEETGMQRRKSKVSIKNGLSRDGEICMFCGRLNNKCGRPFWTEINILPFANVMLLPLLRILPRLRGIKQTQIYDFNDRFMSIILRVTCYKNKSPVEIYVNLRPDIE